MEPWGARHAFGLATLKDAMQVKRIGRNCRFGVRGSRWVIALLLFSQFALAVEACTLLVASPTVAYQSSASCHDEERGSANLCLAHCLQGDQALDKYNLNSVPVAPPPYSVIWTTWSNAVSLVAPLGSRSIVAIDPPLSVRFCSLRL